MAAKKAAKKKSKAVKKGAPKKAALKKAAPKKAAPKKKVVAKKAVAKKAAAPRAPAPPKKPAGPKHQVVHWEIQSTQPERLHSFYRDVFGWEINADNPMKYGLVASGRGSNGIDGGIGGSMGPTAKTIVYAGVPSIEEALVKVSEKGGRTVMPRSDLGMVIIAVFEDPEGNAFGLIEETAK
jgi:predicted enzyme related to lactoylglutathione lyase